MKTVLHVNASPRPATSQGYRLAGELLAALRPSWPGLAILERDLAAMPLLPLSADYAEALTRRTPPQAPAFTLSEALIGELEASDLLLINTPLHNFTLPAALKLWLDYVLRIGRTFASTAAGKHGLLADRPVYLLVGSGGHHRGPHARQPDFLTAYLRHALGTLGLFDLHFIYLEGLVGTPADVADTLAAAREQLSRELPFRPLANPLTTTLE
ncbi:FMN-dependent NADH-azoreductase [Pseudomonas sp. SORGH_AS 211]|uniref:FMN-dependent NADH-azoreductase n=1 Tax=Pseudomonas sp. SORGH_AS_0211 TaxID=3041796 RepID=UPI00286660B6|nr:NAD(P)H-dependent oxidoreductase [Pseudomonas sp. SORGH_AS_0211]MDR6177530.1 FMN-dependent NADH-azoreductase [Pseudomonas sp. SORGH_AS_0211]